jgi:flavin-dependent dehydrogenase
MFDLHVVGAGPAGSIAALSAIRHHNFNVLVSEEHQSAGVPAHCSGLFSKDGLLSLSDFFDYRKFVINSIRGAIFNLAGEEFVVATRNDIAYVCARQLIDKELAAAAEKEGAKIDYHSRITDKFAAKNIIGADGANSSVASYFRFPKIRKFVLTQRAILKYEAENKHMVEVFLSNKIPGFFGWIIPHNESFAEFGCGVLLPNNARNAFMFLLHIKGIKKVPKITSAIIPIALREKTSGSFNGKNVLLVGDAAGQTKASTGGGVIFGASCARYAGKYANNPFFYEIAWRRRYYLDLYIHSLIHEFYSRRSDEELRAISKKIKEKRLDKYLSLHGHMDKPTKIIKPALLIHLLKNL